MAILDLIARGRTVDDIAMPAGREKTAMEDLLLTASPKLANHYEARPKEAQ